MVHKRLGSGLLVEGDLAEADTTSILAQFRCGVEIGAGGSFVTCSGHVERPFQPRCLKEGSGSSILWDTLLFQFWTHR